MTIIRSFIERYSLLADAEWQQISMYFTSFDLKKDEILLQEGKICRHLYFLESGLLRFYFDKDGTDFTKYFAVAPYMFTAQNSFTQIIPATESMQALENCKIWRMNREDAFKLLALRPWNDFIRQLVQEVQFYTDQILTEMQTETAENRYRIMLEKEPEMVQRIPLKYLASYLGIAPQSLSRIRKKLT